MLERSTFELRSFSQHILPLRNSCEISTKSVNLEEQFATSDQGRFQQNRWFPNNIWCTNCVTVGSHRRQKVKLLPNLHLDRYWWRVYLFRFSVSLLIAQLNKYTCVLLCSCLSGAIHKLVTPGATSELYFVSLTYERNSPHWSDWVLRLLDSQNFGRCFSNHKCVTTTARLTVCCDSPS